MLPLTMYGPDYAINHHLTPFISMQNHYNLVYREEEREMMPTLKVSVPCPSAITLVS
jgi:aryl-alcohol dehydrogenase-like predicted oxidoreductase